MRQETKELFSAVASSDFTNARFPFAASAKIGSRGLVSRPYLAFLGKPEIDFLEPQPIN